MKVRIIEVRIPSVGGYDVFISKSYRDATSTSRGKHFNRLEEVLDYVVKALKELEGESH